MNDELKKILLKARELYLKYGIKSITMDDVARELAISKKTIYQHVTDKDDLVGKFVEYEVQLRQDEIFTCFQLGFNAVEEMIEITFFMAKLLRDQNPAIEYDLRKYYPHHFEKMTQTRREKILNYILLNLKKGKSEGLYRDDLNEEVIAKIYLARSENNNLHELFTNEEFSSFSFFLELITYHIRGIATVKGISVLEKKIKELKTKTNK